MDIKVSQESTVKELFSEFLNIEGENYQFSIPIYQREYSWREQQWQELFDDLVHSFNKPSMDTDYWGNVIVYKNRQNKVFELVDGQQRVITLLLLIASLAQIEKSNDYLPLKFHNEGINEIWKKISKLSYWWEIEQNRRLSEEEEQEKKSYSLSQVEKRSFYYRACEYFKQEIEEKGIDKTDLLEHLYKTKLSVVVVDDELESNLLFGRLNTRGMSLSDVDLIKHKLFYDTERRLPPTGDDEVLKLWKELLQKTSTLGLSIDLFIKIWWDTHYGIGQKGLYKSFLSTLELSEYLSLLQNWLQDAEEISEWKANDAGSDNKIGRNLKWLIKLSNSEQVWAAIMGLQVTTNKQKVELVELLTVIEFTRAITSQVDCSKLDIVYLDFGKQLLTDHGDIGITDNDISIAILRLKEAIKTHLPDLSTFTDGFTNLRFHEKGEWETVHQENLLSRYAIYTLNNWLDTRNHGPGVKYRTRDDDEYSIEHIKPKSSASYGETSPEYKIGNLVVLEKQINNDLGDDEINEKLLDYKKSSYPQMKEFLFKNQRQRSNKFRENNAMEWKVDNFDDMSIENRGRYLAICFHEKIKKLLDEKKM
ncbi:DUF262 domain-containing protein [Streptococcus pneumoniae]